MRRATAGLMLCLGAAAGCTNLFHSDAKPEQTYVLRAPAAAEAGADGATSCCCTAGG